MRSESEILLVTSEENVKDTVKSVLDKSEHIRLAGVCQDLPKLRSLLSKRKVQAVVVDIDPDPERLLRELGTVLATYPETYFVVVCSHFNKEMVVRAMQAGARHFLEKKTISSELAKELQALVEESRKKGDGLSSLVISVFSAGGGCGATTAAVNLASELRQLSSRPVLAIDLDGFYGTMSTYLGIKSQYGVADVLARSEQIDEHLIKSSAFAYAKDFHVLVSPAGIDSPQATSLHFENLARVLEACRQAYAHTVVDAPRMPEPTATNLAGLSDVILIVFQLTVKDVYFARRIVSSLTKAGIASERILPLANRAKNRGPLVRLEDSKKAVGLTSCHAIRNDWRKAMKSVNRGYPLSQVAARSGLRSDYRKLAAKVTAYGTSNRAKIGG
jgi:pilus assembly protein CpaE